MENYDQQKFCPDNNLVWAILCTILCCLPLGIVAIIKSTSVEKLWREGRFQEAEKAAADAKKFSIWGAVISAIFLILYFILVVALGVVGALA